MTSRLDRLVTLLETGSTPVIRNTAAQQLADIQKKHPDDLFNLLTRIVPYLKAKSWDTRVAAAKALGGIVENADKFTPNDESVSGDLKINDLQIKEEEDAVSQSEDQLQLETLDAASILANGKKLLGSAGREYDYFLAAMDPADRLAHQKKTLTSRLGLGGEFTEEDLIDESDLVKAARPPVRDSPAPLKISVDRKDSVSSSVDNVASPHEPPGQAGGDEGGLSRRQLNMLKRKSKKEMKTQASKVRVVDLSERKQSAPTPQSAHAPEPHAIKRESNEHGANGSSDYFSLERQGEDDNTKVIAEFKGAAAPGKSELQPEADEEGVEWPFERLCEYLMVDLFDHNWEVRHGAAIGLREVIRVHGAGAGRERGKSRTHNNILNKRWLDDLACRICCIFMLDRFGDYVSDNVVAPIRESAGQTLGAMLQYMTPDSVQAVYRILYRLVMQEDLSMEKRIWQACHGGMIGMRYLVAVRTDLLLEDRNLMDGVLEAVIRGLGDWDDDVRAVSAATLIPVAQDLVNLLPSALSHLVTIVWNCLSNLSDDLSASTGSVMDLLAKLCSFQEVLEVMKTNAASDPEQSFANLVPRLYPFFRHTITSVRSAVLRALLTFLNIEGEGTKDWIDGKALRLLFQNLLVERDRNVLELSLKVWNAFLDERTLLENNKLVDELEPHLTPLITLTFHPIGVSRSPLPMNPSLFIRPSGQAFVLPNYAPKSSPKREGEPPVKRRRKSIKDREPTPQPASPHNIDGPMIMGDVELVGTDTMIRSKIAAAKALGKAMRAWPESQRLGVFKDYIVQHVTSSFSSTRLAAAMAAEEYAKLAPEGDELGKALASAFRPLVEDEPPAYYQDLVSYWRNAQQYCQALRNTFERNCGVSERHLPEIGATVQGDGNNINQYAFSLQQGERIIGADFDRIKASLTPAKRITTTQLLEDARTDARQAIEEARALKEKRDVTIRAAAASVAVAFRDVPKKPTPIIKGLMDSIKAEENVDLQKRSASSVVSLIQLLVSNGKKVIVEKVVGNLAKFYCSDLAETADFHWNASIEVGVISLRKDEDISDHEDQAKFEREAKAVRITRRGARDALEQLTDSFGAALLDELPGLVTLLETPLKQAFGDSLPLDIKDAENMLGQQAVDSMSVIRVLLPKLHASLQPFILNLFPYILTALKSSLAVFRYAAAKCFATICNVMNVEGFSALIKQVLPSIANAHDVCPRQGAIECVYHLIHVMEEGILPYVIFLIVPVLGRMSDSDNDVRLIATTAFATLVKLVPLEAGIPDPPGLSPELLEGRERERKFMAQMLDFKKVEPFEMPVTIKAQLRTYQQEGVNWLAFLNRYQLHGVLCDDMGLGKTLQTLCIVASDHHMRAEEFEKTGNPEVRRLPSLIVCPPTLSGHWQQEIKMYSPFLSAVAYVGSPAERSKVLPKLSMADIVITSYDICRNDVGILAPMNWNYCVLDEGHLIKNPLAKTTQAVKRLKSYHRLILSGTPIQNNVFELWSLFDFLMPGFLGTEKVFKDRFAKPIAASRFSKSSSKEQESGALAVEALHKQVLPFLLRRLKEEVLDDLPPKILQNYYCDLSDLQRKLFEDFTKKEGKALTDMAQSGDKEAKQHIFTALQYMRKLCNSPALVLKEGHKQYDAMQKMLAKTNSSIRDPAHAPKLAALRDLLLDCGIGAADARSSSSSTAAAAGPDADARVLDEAVSQHRALIFCQMKEMLDIVQDDVLRRMLPSVTFLRLDGGVEAARRQDIVNRFNSDPSYDVLLLTTSVGGLGLNLTGADTVIFVEHDWNPQKDIQAMDRAHRIGQKKVVNVHRLITRGTLEEKIMSLQRFKIDVASTVVNQQNAGLATMETDQILDLFSLGEAGAVEPAADDAADADAADAVDAVTGEVREKGKRGFLDDLGELWDERQYEDEYNLDDFLAKMKA